MIKGKKLKIEMQLIEPIVLSFKLAKVSSPNVDHLISCSVDDRIVIFWQRKWCLAVFRPERLVDPCSLRSMLVMLVRAIWSQFRPTEHNNEGASAGKRKVSLKYQLR